MYIIFTENMKLFSKKKKKAFHITERLKNNLFLKSKKSLKSL